MPPKRKRVDAGTEAPATTRATRSSARTANKSEATSNELDDTDASAIQGSSVDAVEVAAPPTKKPKSSTTRASASKAKVSAAKGKAKIAKALVDETGNDEEPAAKSSKKPQLKDDGEAESSKGSRSTAVLHEPYTPQRALALFSQYADSDDPDVIGPEGFEKLCTDAGVSLEGALPLILAWQLKASEMGKFTRAEWVQGTGALEISSLPLLAQALKDLEDLLILDKEPLTHTSTGSSVRKHGGSSKPATQSPYNQTRYWMYVSDQKAAFSELYQFCFILAKPPQGRNIDIETAIAFWSVLLGPRYPIITDVIEFLNEKGTYKGANKDLWSMMLEFCRTVDRSLKDYEADGAWPTLLDDFVAWRRGKMTSTSNTDSHNVAEE